MIIGILQRFSKKNVPWSNFHILIEWGWKVVLKILLSFAMQSEALNLNYPYSSER